MKSIVTIDKNIKIIIVENSLNYKFKSEIERKYQNIKVIMIKVALIVFVSSVSNLEKMPDISITCFMP